MSDTINYISYSELDGVIPPNGRMIREDDTIVNVADLLVNTTDKINTLVPTPTTFTFQNATTTTGQGSILTVGNFKNLTVDIYGTATERRIKFYSMNSNNDLIPLGGCNISNFTIATESYVSPTCIPANLGTNNSETFQFDITNLNKIIMEVETISGGNVTVIGKLK